MPELPDISEIENRAWNGYGPQAEDAVRSLWPHMYAAALRHAAERLDAGPEFPLPKSVFMALLNEYADAAVPGVPVTRDKEEA